jgi:hypothetical protein
MIKVAPKAFGAKIGFNNALGDRVPRRKRDWDTARMQDRSISHSILDSGSWCLMFLRKSGNAPVKIRTSNLLIRSQMLYPVELRALRSQLICEGRAERQIAEAISEK